MLDQYAQRAAVNCSNAVWRARHSDAMHDSPVAKCFGHMLVYGRSGLAGTATYRLRPIHPREQYLPLPRTISDRQVLNVVPHR